MNLNHVYNIGILCMVTGTILNMLGLVWGFAFWMISNSIFLFKGHHEGDKTWTVIFAVMLFSSIFGYGYWTIN